MFLLLFATYKIGGKVVAYKKSNDLMLVSLYEANAIKNQEITLDTTAHHVLCIGNSITWHAPLKGDLPGADSHWRGDWGMCAAKAEFDFVHQLEQKFKRVNQATTVDRVNLWEWEYNFNINKDSLFGNIFNGKDLIVLKIGETVKQDREEQYGQAFDELVTYFFALRPMSS